MRIVVGSGATLRGTVISSEDRTPIADAFVGPETADGGSSTQTALPVTSTRADGTFELSGIAAGPLAIRVYGRGYAAKIEELPEASDGAAIGPITIELTPREPPPARDRDLSGIGVNVIPEGNALRVVAVLPNSGAVDAGLDAGDLIVSVDDLPVATLGVDGAIARLRGPPGTSVTLTVRRDGHDRRRSVSAASSTASSAGAVDAGIDRDCHRRAKVSTSTPDAKCTSGASAGRPIPAAVSSDSSWSASSAGCSG